MAIIKRRSPVERFQDTHGETWDRVKNFPMIRHLVRVAEPTTYLIPGKPSQVKLRYTVHPDQDNRIDTSTENFVKMIDGFAHARWISEVRLDVKIFFYALELVCHRADIPGFLPEEFVPQLRKHMSTLAIEERVAKFDGIHLAFHQCFMWDIPAFLQRYPKPGSLRLPSAAKAPISHGFKPKPRPAKLAGASPIKPPPRKLRKPR